MIYQSNDLKALLKRIENLESGYSLGDIAYLKAHYDELYRRVEAFESNEFLAGLLSSMESNMIALQNSGDTEAAHGIADEYLVTLIKNLATDENREQLKRIIDAYNAMDKWYA